jgi:plastocyanin
MLKATDPDGDTLTYSIVTPPAHGTLSAGTGATRTFTPTTGYSGADSFTFRVSDGSTNSGLATVNLTIAAKYKVTITDSAFSPITSKPVQGGTVRFINSGTAARTITDISGMGLFGASINPGAEYAFRFTAAGKYEYSCSCGGSTGAVAVPMKILPAAGGTSVVRTVTWAVEDPAAGYVFDVQIKRPGVPGWTNWRTGVTTLSSSFTPDAGNGTYKFKARLRNTTNNTHSQYSAAKAVSVS